MDGDYMGEEPLCTYQPQSEGGGMTEMTLDTMDKRILDIIRRIFRWSPGLTPSLRSVVAITGAGSA